MTKALFPKMVVNSERLVTGVVGFVGYIVTVSGRYKKSSRWRLRKANHQAGKLRMSSQNGSSEFGVLRVLSLLGGGVSVQDSHVREQV